MLIGSMTVSGKNCWWGLDSGKGLRVDRVEDYPDAALGQGR